VALSITHEEANCTKMLLDAGALLAAVYQTVPFGYLVETGHSYSAFNRPAKTQRSKKPVHKRASRWTTRCVQLIHLRHSTGQAIRLTTLNIAGVNVSNRQQKNTGGISKQEL